MVEPVKVFTKLEKYDPSRRSYLTDLLRILVNQRTLKENRSLYGTVVDRYALVNRIDEADLVVLPYYWNYYYHARQTSSALEFIKQAKPAEKPVITWLGGDFGARVPVEDVWIFGAAGYRSRSSNKRMGVPVFIRDPLREYGFEHIQPRPKQKEPLIGFCGYARTTPLKTLAFMLNTLVRNTASALHISGAEPQTLYPPPVLLRQRILKKLSHSPRVETDFIQNTRYQAGARTAEDQQEARRRFFNNIRGTDYTLCVRGSGNFSVRLYETLAMGRIPILIDTDCLLPYAADPLWQQCCVYLKQDQIPYVAEIVADFHSRLSEGDFVETQHQARRFWEERLSLEGYFLHFPEHFLMSTPD